MRSFGCRGLIIQGLLLLHNDACVRFFDYIVGSANHLSMHCKRQHHSIIATLIVCSLCRLKGDYMHPCFSAAVRSAYEHAADCLERALKDLAATVETAKEEKMDEAEAAQAAARGGGAIKGKAAVKRRGSFARKVKAAKKKTMFAQRRRVFHYGGRAASSRVSNAPKATSEKARRGVKGASGFSWASDCSGGCKASGMGRFRENAEIDALTTKVNACEKAMKAKELDWQRMHSSAKRAADEVMLAEMKVKLWALFWAMENRGRTRPVAMIWALLATTEDLVRSRFQKMRTEQDQEMEFQRQLGFGV